MARDHKAVPSQLWPRGDLHPKPGAGSNLELLWTALMQEANRFGCEAEEKLNEVMPDQTGAFLEDWERILGLPLCGEQLESREERRDMVLAMLNIGPFTNLQFFTDIAALFGFTITAEEFRPFRAGSSRAGEPLNSEIQMGTIKISAVCTDPTFFRAGGSGAGERLSACGNAGLICILEHFKLSFQFLFFEFS